jgi:hypothetical protein
MKTPPIAIETAWYELPPAERRVLNTLLRLLRGASRSQSQDVARAARKWERGLSFFIKLRLINQRRGRKR